MPFGAHFLDRTVLRASNRKIETALGWMPEYPTYRDGVQHWAEVFGTSRGAPRGANTTLRR
jgi:hypothetical protein